MPAGVFIRFADHVSSEMMSRAAAVEMQRQKRVA
jgi:hypothetical protein